MPPVDAVGYHAIPLITIAGRLEALSLGAVRPLSALAGRFFMMVVFFSTATRAAAREGSSRGISVPELSSFGAVLEPRPLLVLSVKNLSICLFLSRQYEAR